MEIEIKSSKGIMFPIELAKLCGIYEATVYAVLWDAAKDHNGTISMSYNQISNQTDIPSRSIPRLITKLELSHVLTREYHQGQPPTYHVKNIMLEDNKQVELQEQKLPEQVPALRSDERQPEPKYVWQASDGGLKPGYKWYGKRKKVALSDSDYASLCSVYGKNTVNDYINRVDRFCATKANFYYPDYDAIIEYWIEQDYQKASAASAKGKDKPISPKKKKQLDEYLSLANRFDEDEFEERLYGEYKRVLLTDEGYGQLCTRYGKAKVDAYITEMDRWCEAKNESYPNYKAALEMWIERDIKKVSGNDVLMQQELREINKYLDLVD